MGVRPPVGPRVPRGGATPWEHARKPHCVPRCGTQTNGASQRPRADARWRGGYSFRPGMDGIGGSVNTQQAVAALVGHLVVLQDGHDVVAKLALVHAVAGAEVGANAMLSSW